MTQRKVGWIGLGNIGSPMASRLLKAGYSMRVWARRPEAAQAVIDEGAVWVDEPAALARDCDVLVTVLGGPQDVLSVYRRMLPGARPGTVCLEMSTAAPATAQQLRALAAEVGAVVLDCPVTGGVAGAREGKLTHFVGGDREALGGCKPLLEVLSRRIVHCGDSGSGYRMKLINQTMMAGALLGLADGAAMARASGIGGDELLDALGAGTASGPLFQAYVHRMVQASGPVTFTIGMLRKDLLLAHSEAVVHRSSTRLLDFALAAIDEACSRFGDDAGVQSLAVS
ncbi:NAD(P)-dependent oxidoreductase (plasmid) [Polaromonas sp. P1-6]|nr:NAD(P)-dependent oxidoreductase [Polaromonas sp. P1-6]